MKTDAIPYEDAIRNEVLRNLGLAVFNFRNLASQIDRGVAYQMATEELIAGLNSLYQKSFTEVMDCLVCARDMKMSRIALEGVSRHLDKERGFRVDKPEPQ